MSVKTLPLTDEDRKVIEEAKKWGKFLYLSFTVVLIAFPFVVYFVFHDIAGSSKYNTLLRYCMTAAAAVGAIVSYKELLAENRGHDTVPYDTKDVRVGTVKKISVPNEITIDFGSKKEKFDYKFLLQQKKKWGWVVPEEVGQKVTVEKLSGQKIILRVY